MFEFSGPERIVHFTYPDGDELVSHWPESMLKALKSGVPMRAAEVSGKFLAEAVVDKIETKGNEWFVALRWK